MSSSAKRLQHSRRHFHIHSVGTMVKPMKHRARRAFIAPFALLLLLGVIHAAAKTNLASMMADRQSQSTGDEAVSAALARKPKALLSRKKAIVKKHKHQEKEDEALSSPAQKLPAEPVEYARFLKNQNRSDKTSKKLGQ